MQVGHTIQAGVNGACGQQVLRVDVGMSQGCGNSAVEVLEILGDKQVGGVGGGWEGGGGKGGCWTCCAQQGLRLPRHCRLLVFEASPRRGCWSMKGLALERLGQPADARCPEVCTLSPSGLSVVVAGGAAVRGAWAASASGGPPAARHSSCCGGHTQQQRSPASSSSGNSSSSKRQPGW